MKPFEHTNRFKYPIAILLAIGFAYLMASGGIKASIIVLLLPFLLVYLVVSFGRAHLLMHTVVIMGFIIVLMSRYIPGDTPFGLLIDGLLVLIIVSLAFDKRVRFDKEATFNPLNLALIGWLILTFLELANPLATSKVAWFYAMRGLSLYPVMLAVLTIYVYNKKDILRQFLWIWALLSLIATLWGMKQLLFGVSDVEQAWLNAGAASTHILFGKLRVFSYFSDAAQFGASQAHTAVVFGIIALYPGKLKYRWPLLLFALLSLYGMLISGTRGAVGVLALGGFTYFVMTKNFKVVLIGILAAGAVFVFLKYTTLMQSNYQVNRLRTALRADDPSLMVRKQRELILSNYLADKPFGGGIGSAGYWGKRFSPGTVLADLGTDGHYTRIWMETGIVGLYAYLMMLGSIAIFLGIKLWTMDDSLLRQVLVGFYSGFLGVCLASYTNGLLTQIPTGVVLFISLSLIYLGTTGRLK